MMQAYDQPRAAQPACAAGSADAATTGVTCAADDDARLCPSLREQIEQWLNAAWLLGPDTYSANIYEHIENHVSSHRLDVAHQMLLILRRCIHARLVFPDGNAVDDSLEADVELIDDAAPHRLSIKDLRMSWKTEFNLWVQQTQQFVRSMYGGELCMDLL